MSEEKEVTKLGHVYDGIEEHDNAIPNWFRALFYSTMAFALVYFLYYTVGEGPTLTREFERNRRDEEYTLYERDSKTPKKSFSETELLAIYKDASRRMEGQKSFQSKCVSCHGAAGGGGIGPNLTDEYWIHGGKLSEVVHTITTGVAEKGMPPWGPVLTEREIHSLAAYIRSLHGTRPPGSKEPQGERVKFEE